MSRTAAISAKCKDYIFDQARAKNARRQSIAAPVGVAPPLFVGIGGTD